jgi:hypothetical protein
MAFKKRVALNINTKANVIDASERDKLYVSEGIVTGFSLGINLVELQPPLWSNGQSSWLQSRSTGSIPGAIRFSEN